jgi:hypothetical protein
MDFPSFGDAPAYWLAGERCAQAIVSRQSSVIDGCYQAHRPVGMMVWSALPFLVSDDPVDRAYVALALNVVAFLVLWAGLRSTLAADPALAGRLGGRRLRWLQLALVVTVLANVVPHLPVTLSDLPALSAFGLSIAAGMRYLRALGEGRPDLRWIILAGLGSAAATLVRQRYFLFALVLLGALVFLMRSTWRIRIRAAASFCLGFAAVLIQFVAVLWHSGVFWLYDPAGLERFRQSEAMPRVDAQFYTLPTPGGFVVEVTNAVSWPALVVLRLFTGVFGFEWAVYKGHATRPPQWTLGAADVSFILLLVAVYLGVTVAAALRGPVSVRLLNLVALGVALVLAVSSHTELRYFLLPRMVGWTTLAYVLLTVRRAHAPGDSAAVGR